MLRPTFACACRWLGFAGILFTVFPGSAEQPGSLLLNGDFEQGDEAGVPGWNLQVWPEAGAPSLSGALARSNVRARTGQWSLRVDTQPLLGSTRTLVFNGAIAGPFARLRGQRLDLSGWVWVEPDAALRPFSMVLRVWGEDNTGRTVLLGTPISASILGRLGQWWPFHASGLVPDGDIASMDLHRSLRPDVVRTVQFIDSLRLEQHVEAPLAIRLPRPALWRDESSLPVGVQFHPAEPSKASLVFELKDSTGRTRAHWRRPAHSGMLGLNLPKPFLPEGGYRLQTKCVEPGRPVLVATGFVELASSPWENPTRPRPHEGSPGSATAVPEAFAAMGTVAPAEITEEVPSEPEPVSEGLIPRSAVGQGYALFARDPLELPSAMSRPKPGEMDRIRLFGAPGQYVDGAVSVCAMKPLAGVRVELGALQGGGETIGPIHGEVRLLRSAHGLPAFLEKRAPVDIPAGQTRTFWLSLRIPASTPPGTYVGQVTVTPEQAPAALMELVLWVLPLRLPPVEKGYGFWWKMDGRWQGHYSAERSTALEQIRKQFVLLRELGFNMVSVYGMPKMSRRTDGSVSFDFEQDEFGHDRFSLGDLARLGTETRFFSLRQPLQYPGAESLYSDWIARALGFDSHSADFEAFYQRACRAIARWAAEHGVNLAFACVDEIGNGQERVQAALRFYRLAKESGVLTSVTDNSMHGGVHLLGQKRFDDIVDLRVYNYITPEMVQTTRDSHDSLWLYNLGSGGARPAQERFVFGFFAERCGAVGYAQWAFQWPVGNKSPYEAVAAGQKAGWDYALPAPDGPLPTVGLEAARQGIDDARYLALLRKASPETAAAILKDIEPYSNLIGEYIESHPGTAADIRRWKIARAVLRCQDSIPARR